ncbi:MAG: hypothetical protein R3194_07920 [Limnobacter sp.]|nr:hypothetical protein [Limnobacter sp.]
MLSAWETVWACVLLTAVVMAFDAYMASRLKAKSKDRLELRHSRQKTMKYKQIEDSQA